MSGPLYRTAAETFKFLHVDGVALVDILLFGSLTGRQCGTAAHKLMNLLLCTWVYHCYQTVELPHLTWHAVSGLDNRSYFHSKSTSVGTIGLITIPACTLTFG